MKKQNQIFTINFKRPSEIIANNRPYFALSSADLQDQLEYLEEEIESRGGFETMSLLLRTKYLSEIDLIVEEIALRN